MQAIEDGSITAVQEHITRLESEGKSLQYLNKRCKDKHGKTFVHSAVAHNQVAILKLLLDHKAGKVQYWLKLQSLTVFEINHCLSKQTLLVSYARDCSYTYFDSFQLHVSEKFPPKL